MILPGDLSGGRHQNGRGSGDAFPHPQHSVDIRFAERELVWRTYSAAEALPTTRRVEIIDKKEFAVAALNKDDETFVMHTAAISTDSNIHPSRRAQIA